MFTNFVFTPSAVCVRQLRPRLQEPAALPSTASPHRPDDYMSFYHMVALEEMRPAWDYCQRALLASFLLKVLQRANYFGPWDDEGERKLVEIPFTMTVCAFYT